MSQYLDKYNVILKRYYNGEFGNKHLSLNEILEKSGETDLLEKLTSADLQYLMNKSSNGFKQIFSQLLKNKT